MKTKTITCSSMVEVADVFNHNTKVFSGRIRKMDKKLRKLGRRNRSLLWMGVIFGAAIELCNMEQNQKIAALSKEVAVLNTEIEELRGKEGD